MGNTESAPPLTIEQQMALHAYSNRNNGGDSSKPFGQVDDNELLKDLLESNRMARDASTSAYQSSRTNQSSNSVQRQTAAHSYNNRNNGGNSNTPFK
jgi:hypothetical protein